MAANVQELLDAWKEVVHSIETERAGRVTVSEDALRRLGEAIEGEPPPEDPSC
jgi:hypothetical protein